MMRLFFLLLIAQIAWANPFSPLIKEIERNPIEVQPVAIDFAPLRQSVKILEELGDCAGSLYLRRLMLQKGYRADGWFWLKLARNQICLERWRGASHSAWQAVRRLKKDRAQAQAYLSLGDALSQRDTEWSDIDWLRMAAAAYQKALALDPRLDIARQRLQAVRQKQASKKRLLLEDIRYRLDQSYPEICFIFNDRLQAVDQIHYRSYIRIRPAVRLSFSVQGYDQNELCLTGPQFEQDYEILFKAGLKSENKGLEQDLKETISVGARSSEIWFNRSAYILPLHRKGQVQLQHINTNKLQLKLFHIDERNLSYEWVNEHLGEALSQYQWERVQDDLGELVWQEQIQIKNSGNEARSLNIHLPERLIQQKGLYILSAHDPDADVYATQWLVASDLGISSYEDKDGLLLLVRSLSTAEPVSKVRLKLYARNNSVLAEAWTDEQGQARFAAPLLQGEAGLKAIKISADKPGFGFSILPLNHGLTDLSDFAISGQRIQSDFNLYAYSDRGLYRPGETVHWIGLLRDQYGQAITHIPIQIKITDAQQREVVNKNLLPQNSGSYAYDFVLPAEAVTGRWTVDWLIAGRSIQQSHFTVAAIKPPRIQAELKVQGQLEPNKITPAILQADYLFGSPAKDLPVRSRLYLQPEPHPFAQYADFYFLPAKTEISSHRLPSVRTDDRGQAIISLRLPELKPNYPLKAVLSAEVIDTDGEAVRQKASLAVRHLPLYIGIKQLADANQFKIIALDGKGRLQKRALQWRLLALETEYQWSYFEYHWRYRPITISKEIAAGRVFSGQVLTRALDTGRYRLEVFAGDVSSQLEFSIGQTDQAKPNQVRIDLDKTEYRLGERVQLQIKAPFSGKATLILATDRIQQLQLIELDAQGQAQIDLPVKSEWGAGIYALVTAYAKNNASRRALGLKWIALNPIEKRLWLKLQSPQKIKPNQKISIPIEIQGLSPGEQAYLTLAAVDEAVLSLDGFQSPHPWNYFFSQRQFQLKLRDLYDALIQPEPKSGAGSGGHGRKGMPQSHIQITALFSGIVPVDEQGQAVVRFKLPDFNGQLRLMAVAWSNTKLGQAEQRLTVQDDLIVLPALPRFIGAGDRLQARFSLHNMNAPAGDYQIQIKSERLSLHQNFKRALKSQQRTDIDFSLFGGDQIGTAQIELWIQGPQGFQLHKQYALDVRASQTYRVEQKLRRLAPKQSWTISADIFQNYYAQDAELDILISAQPAWNVRGLLQALNRYPYGCLEQLTSRSLPLLYYNELAQKWGLPADSMLQYRLEAAIGKIIQKQKYYGGFGLWSTEDELDIWASLYALEFLLRAQKQGYAVPESSLNQGLRWLKNNLLAEDPYRIYAHYVLNLAGQAKVEDLRYLAEQALDQIHSPLSAAQLGHALAYHGQTHLAKKAFAIAISQPRQGKQIDYQDYGSRLRDQAAVLALLYEAGLNLADPSALIASLARIQQKRRWLSTQEQAWLLLASRLFDPQQSLELDINGYRLDKTGYHRLRYTPDRLRQPVVIKNLGRKAIWISQSLGAIPKKPLASADRGFQIQRQIYDFDGQPVHNLSSGQPVVVKLSGRVTDQSDHSALIIDRLPAGLVIDQPQIEDAPLQKLSWIKDWSHLRYADRLDDRFIAALDLEAEQSFTVYYIARATIAGQYHWPAARIEDMYRPYEQAQSQPQSLLIQP